ncbi:galactose-binding domain-like protein [Syncephalis fuscata]|nr:galactose-binding domain-like protein [Syncephalis fuscata]
MSHCHHEHHGHDGHDHGDDHTHDDEIALVKDLLYEKIDRDNVRGLNESIPGAAKSIIKPWHERNSTTPLLESDSDEQLIVIVPFTGMVKLKSILIKTGRGDVAPSRLSVFVNRDDVDFDTVNDVEATQTWELANNADDVCEYHTRLAKFSSVRSVTLFFPENFGDDITQLTFLGFRGEWTKIQPQPIITVYELQANPADHQTPADELRANPQGFS